MRAEIVDLRRIGAHELESLLVEETAAWRETLDWEFEKSADLVRRFIDMHALNGRALLEDGEVVGYLYYVLEDNESLLVEETAAWRETLDWEFEKSADLVRRFIDMHALNGRALLEDGEVVGYLYYVLEDNKGLLGDLYVRRDRRTVEHENRLMEAALEEIMGGPGTTRIESQLLMMEYGKDRVVPRADCVSRFERNFMQVELNRALRGAGAVRKPVRIERWNDQWNDLAAHLIAAAYEGHVDSRINDQYQSVAGARRFLFNIVQYPGCGVFHRPASFAAFEPESGALCGISLASLVAPDCGHVTQIS